MKPYNENKQGNIIKRTFSEGVSENELVWHRDHEDRIVKVLKETDWMVQFDNELPQKMVVGEEIRIPKNVYHRVIKGSGDLQIEIFETDFKNHLNNSEKNSIFNQNYLKMKLKETFSYEEPLVLPAEPVTKPKESPAIQPSRRNKPFLPERETQPDPKAKD